MLNCQKAWGRQIRSICFPLNYYAFLKGHKNTHTETFLLLMETHVIGEDCYQRLMCRRCEGDEACGRHELTLPWRWRARTLFSHSCLPSLSDSWCSLRAVTRHTKCQLTGARTSLAGVELAGQLLLIIVCTKRSKQLNLKCDFFQTWKPTIPTSCFRICGIGKPSFH